MYRTLIEFDNSDISRLLSCFHADEMQNLPGVNLVVPVSTRLCLTDEIESGDDFVIFLWIIYIKKLNNRERRFEESA